MELNKTLPKILADINYRYIMSGDQVMAHCGWTCLFYSVYGYRYMIVNSVPPSLDVVSMSSFVGIFILLGVFLK